MVRAEFTDPTPSEFLLTTEEFVRDLACSRDVRWFAPYDQAARAVMVDGFYRGETKRAQDLDWWLSFELGVVCYTPERAWRKMMRRRRASVEAPAEAAQIVGCN
jgi:hypothetical protein